MNWIAHQYWPQLNRKHLRWGDIQPVVAHYRCCSEVEVELLGHSFQHRPIEQLIVGKGKRHVLAWTQMHGDEPTATAAVFDIIEQLLTDRSATVKQILNDFTLHFIPMLNPDGAEQNTRENAQGIDINRDARKLCSPEAKVLHQAVTEIRPEIAFNLHDQSRYYGVGDSNLLSTIAFLAPPFDKQQTINDSRRLTMQLIATMRDVLETQIPGHVARYVDDYSPRCFGDTIAGLGASTILIESGEYPNDPYRQQARLMNRLAIFTALKSASSNITVNNVEEHYFAIPPNNENHWGDIVLRSVTMLSNADSESFQTDVLIRMVEGQYRIIEIGDLGTQCGITELACDRLTLSRGKPYNLSHPLTLDETTYKELLTEGYSHFVATDNLLDVQTELAVFCDTQALPTALLKSPACAILREDDTPRYAILGQRLVPLQRDF